MSQLSVDRRETWITGIGLVSSLGDGLEANWDTLRCGRINVDLGKYAPWIVHPLVPLDLDSRFRKGRPAPDGSMAAHRYLRSRPRPGFRGDQGRQGNPGSNRHDRRCGRRRARPRRRLRSFDRACGWKVGGPQRTADERSAPTLFLAQLSKAPSVLQLCEIGTRPSYGAGNDRHAIVRIYLGSGKYPLAPGTQPTGG